ncbi:cytochrome P450 [Pelagophyceae sp. CCMP2097]|nr:cytochrome P450 [Pelagophyceae sp. CCMP2097]
MGSARTSTRLWVVALCACGSTVARALQPSGGARPARATTRLNVKEVLDKPEVANDRDEVDKYADELSKSWECAWDDPNCGQKKEGFDWEMEKLRRQLDRVPSKYGGPKYWRRWIEATPESKYRSYAGSTYPGSKPGAIDAMRILFNNLLQFLGNDSEDGAKVAAWDWQGAISEHGMGKLLYSVVTGDLQTLVGGPLFLLLNKYHGELGPVYKLAFGPRSFIVVADPAIARHILKVSAENFDKGILSEILEPIMGNGLIPADPDVWKRRRRVISPGFHKGWLQKTIVLFDQCADELVENLREITLADEETQKSWDARQLPTSVDDWPKWKSEPDLARAAFGVVDMEERLCSVSLDIIGRAVFDFDFQSSKRESPLVRAVYRCLQEAERRTTAFIPIWLLPGAQFIPSQAAFRADLSLLNTKLDELVLNALKDDDAAETAGDEAVALNSTSLLRFLVTMRGEDVSTTQLRDDLMTMLVAGHETTAALLTWVLYELYHPSGRGQEHLDRLRAELDGVFAGEGTGRATTYDDVVAMPFARLCLAEGLRLYPQPPLLIRRALDNVELPRPSADYPAVTLSRGSDVFISTWALHKSEALWDAPLVFDPTRWERPRPPGPGSPAGWAGYVPNPSTMYPSEQSADYAYLPFGGGGRRCLGDQFAIIEAAVLLAKLVRNFDFEFALDPNTVLQPKVGLGDIPVADVGMRTGATIHTEHGLWMKPKPRR